MHRPPTAPLTAGRAALAAALAGTALTVVVAAPRSGPPAAGAQGSCYGDLADLKGWWPLDDDPLSETAVDVVGGHTARHVGGPAAATGRRGLARGYGKNAQWSEVRAPASGLDIAATDLTIDAWIRLPLATSRVAVARTGRVAIAEKRSTAGGAGYAFSFDGGFLGFELVDAAGRSAAYSSRSGPSIGAVGAMLPVDAEWHFVAVVVRRVGTGTGVWFVLDGVTTAATGATGGRAPAIPLGSLVNDSPLRIGRRMAGSGSGGSPVVLDDVEVFARAVGGAALDAIRRDGKCAPTGATTPTASATATLEPSSTPSTPPTATATATAAITATATLTATAVATATPALTPTVDVTATAAPTDTASPTATATATASSTPTPTVPPSATPTPSPTPTSLPPCTPSPADLRAWWPLDDGAGGVARDAAGDHDGALVGGAAWLANGAVGGALGFDGLTARVAVPDADGLDLAAATGPAPAGDLTIELWLRRRERGGALQALVDKLTRDQGYALWLSDGRPLLYLASGGLTVPTPFDAVVGVDGRWRHLAVVVDRHLPGVAARVYLDGARVAAGSALVSGALDNDVPLQLGSANLSPYLPFSGDLDEVSLHGRALGDAEIAALAASGGKCR